MNGWRHQSVRITMANGGKMAAMSKTRSKLTPKQRAFVDEYLVDLNATQAARRAGYKGNDNTLSSVGNENLNKPAIAAAVKAALDARSKRIQVDADWVLKHLSEIAKADIADIMADDGGFKPLSEWPQIWRQMVSGLDISEIWDGPRGQRNIIGQLKKLKTVSRERIIEMVGKHVDVNAFQETHKHELDDVTRALIAGRQRVS